MPSTATTFAGALREYRLAAALTQQALAERAGLSARGVSDLERGVRQRPQKVTLELLAGALGLSARERARLEALADVAPAAPILPARPGRPSRAARRSEAAEVGTGRAAELPLVGRGRALALIEEQLRGATPPLVMFAGEPGIGKSRLLREARSLAARGGWTVLAGGCTRRGGQVPFAPVLDAIREGVTSRAAARLRADLLGCAWLVRLLPELCDGPIEPLPGWTISPEQERRLLFLAIEHYLGNVAGPSGTLLLLDDLQWAGPDALDLLCALARGGVRLIGAYRDAEARPGDPLSVALADLAQAGRVVHHTLPPLTIEESGNLLAGLLTEGPPVDPAEQQRLVQRAGGVPFFLVSCARGLRTGTTEAVPWDLAQSLRQRLAALPMATREGLGVAAVIGRVAPRRLLAAVLGWPAEELLAALAAACTAQLLREEGSAAYAFLHDVTREIVETDLGAARRALLHLRVAEALEHEPSSVGASRTSPIERLAYHYGQGESWPQALDYLVQAGDKARAAYANQDALAFYAQALTVSETLGDAALPTAALVAQRRGDVQMLIQQVQGAIADYSLMVEIARRLRDQQLEGLALACLGAAEAELHEFEKAETSLRAALVIGEEGFDEVRQTATIVLSYCLVVGGRKSEGATVLLDARERALQRGDASLHQACEGMLALFCMWDGRFEDALVAWGRSDAGMKEALPDRVAQWWVEALILGGKGEYEAALSLLHNAVTVCERTGELWTGRRAPNTLGWLYGELQDHRRALAWNTKGLEAARERLAPETTSECENNARLNLADTLVALGRPDEAEGHFRAVERIVRNPRSHDRFMLWRYAQHLFHSYGELWLSQGDAPASLAYADECLALAVPTTSGKYLVKGRRLRGQALLALGRPAEAARELDLALQIARQVGNPAQLWKSYAAWGDLCMALGREQEARGSYRAAYGVIDRVAAALKDVSLRATFIGSAHVDRIRRSAGTTHRV